MKTSEIFSLLVFSFATMTAAGDQQPDELQQAFETPTGFQASDVLLPEMLSGDHFQVLPDVQNDGFMNFYTVESDFGTFAAYGNLALLRLIREIRALAELEEVSKTEVFLKSAAEAGTRPLKTIQRIVEHPVETVTGLPGGIVRMFDAFQRDVEKGYDTAVDVGGQTVDAVVPGDDTDEEGATDESDEALTEQASDAAVTYANKWFGVTGAEREWYQKLQVDPYTRNVVLREKIRSIAYVDAAADFGIRFAPIPRIPGFSYVRKVEQAVWTIDPEELRERNINTLREAGVEEELIQGLMNNEFLSPTQQTLLLMTLGELKGVEGLTNVLNLLAMSESYEVAEFNLANTLFLWAYNRHVRPVRSIFSGQTVPVALDADDNLVAIVSVDYIFWEEIVAGTVVAMDTTLDERSAVSRQIWLRGQASPRFETEAAALGWTVRENIGLRDRIIEKFIRPAGDKPDEEVSETENSGDEKPDD